MRNFGRDFDNAMSDPNESPYSRKDNQARDGRKSQLVWIKKEEELHYHTDDDDKIIQGIKDLTKEDVRSQSNL